LQVEIYKGAGLGAGLSAGADAGAGVDAGVTWVRVRVWRERGCDVGAGAGVAWMWLGGSLGSGFRELGLAIRAWRLRLRLEDCDREG
jgi:hypothetical protein